MAVRVIMPALEMAQETGKLLSWKKKQDERVSKGEPLLEVETDKAVVEVESPGGGILSGVKAREGDVIPVGETIAWLLQPGEAIPADGTPIQTGRRTESTGVQPAAAAAASGASASPAEIRISPKARRLAREHGLDVSKLRGSGPGGEILAEDILAAAGQAAKPQSDSTSSRTQVAPTDVALSASSSVEKPGTIGRLMAERTTQSWTTVPHFFVLREVDAGTLVETHQRVSPEIEKAHGIRPTLTDLLIALVAGVLAKHPRMNASWAGDGIRHNVEINIGLAVAVEEGVVAPVIRNAQRASLAEIAARRRELTERARANRLQPADLSGATFTISNLGMYDVDAFTAIIVPPQAGILAVGRIAERVVPVDGKPGIRPVISLTLSTDHRVADGARAAQFMNDLAGALREPVQWLR